MLTRHAGQWIDMGHESEFDVPAPPAGLAEDVRLVDVEHRHECIGGAHRAVLEEPSARPRLLHLA